MSAGIKRDEILELAIVGNPIMHHLLLGIDPIPLGSAPFALATDRAVRVKAAELELRTHSGARVYVLPCIAGHVGADTAGVILAEAPHQSEVVELVVDVGTNAEIVLGNRDFLLAASSPTGPAFEGAQISGGQRAAPGAIERVRIDRRDPRAALPGHRLRALVGRAGLRGGHGRHRCHGHLRVRDRRGHRRALPRRRHHPGRDRRRLDGRRERRGSNPMVGPSRMSSTTAPARAGRGSRSPRTTSGRSSWRRPPSTPAFACSWITRGSRRSTRSGWPARSAARSTPFHAMVLGLVPDADLAHVKSAGNAAGTGALIALLSGAARDEIERVVRTVEKIETAVEPRFQQHFVDAMAFPHRTAAYPHLEKVTDLPKRPGDGATWHERKHRAPAQATHARCCDDGGGAMTTDESPRQRTGGRAGRTAARLRTHVERVPFLTRTLKPFEVLDEEGLATIEENADTILEKVGLEFRGDPEALAPVPRRRRRCPGRTGPVPARHVPPDRPGDRPARVHPVRPKPREQRPDRRHRDRPRPELRLAVRPRPRQRPALRHDRGLPQLREARLHEPAPPPQRRDRLRAGRRAGQQAPPRHGLFAHPLQRQAVHGLRHGAGTGPRHRRDGEAHVRGRLPRGPRGDPQLDQRELAARLGRDDARARRGPTPRRTRRRS